MHIKIYPRSFFLLIVLLLFFYRSTEKTVRSEDEREFFSHDFYLNMNEPANEQNYLENNPEQTEEEDSEDEWGKEPSDDEIYYRMSDDDFTVTPEGQKREDIFLLFVLPGMMALVTLSFLWFNLKVWIRKKQEIYQTSKELRQLRRQFRGKEDSPEFHSRLKKVLKLPPGASSRYVLKCIPLRDKEMQRSIRTYDEKFKKPPEE
ncbi:MAG: hypothetical protein WCT05_10750 [Lentisphaeria bacterium]